MSDDIQVQAAASGASDPLGRARLAARPALPRRFYASAAAVEQDGAHLLTLDGKPARTPGRRPLAAPTRALAEALAQEWSAVGETLDPGRMPLTRLANSAIDGVASQAARVIDDIVAYARSDLLCYRAGEPESLAAAQAEAWDPVLDWAREALGARFILAQGVAFVEQPAQAVAAVRAAIERDAAPFRLAALHVMTGLTGSVLLALAQAAGRLDAGEAWAAAHVDERFQERLWGEDAEAKARRDAREAEFRAAARAYALAGEEA